MYVIVVGGGKVGYHLTSALLADGHEALLIEKDPRRYNLLRHHLGEVVFYGDGSEITVLERAGPRVPTPWRRLPEATTTTS